MDWPPELAKTTVSELLLQGLTPGSGICRSRALGPADTTLDTLFVELIVPKLATVCGF